MRRLENGEATPKRVKEETRERDDCVGKKRRVSRARGFPLLLSLVLDLSIFFFLFIVFFLHNKNKIEACDYEELEKKGWARVRELCFWRRRTGRQRQNKKQHGQNLEKKTEKNKIYVFINLSLSNAPAQIVLSLCVVDIFCE